MCASPRSIPRELALLFALATAMALAGCGDTSSPAPQPRLAPAAGAGVAHSAPTADPPVDPVVAALVEQYEPRLPFEARRAARLLGEASDLRLTSLDEAAVAAMDHSERLARVDAIANTLRGIVNRLLESARTSALDGDAFWACRLADAACRLAEANAQPPLPHVLRTTAFAALQRAEAVRHEVCPDAPPPRIQPLPRDLVFGGVVGGVSGGPDPRP